MSVTRLYCYVCGKTIALTGFFILTMRPETDRVFLCCANGSCRAQLDDCVVIEVEQVKGRI